jgi:hypothetical protein
MAEMGQRGLPRLLTRSSCGDLRLVDVADCARIRNNAAVFEKLGLSS